MWQCPNCGEQHDKDFRTCWKCGTGPKGDRDPEFRITEPVREQDQVADSATGDTVRPALQLPTVSYFCMPFFCCFLMYVNFRQVMELEVLQQPDFRPSPLEIAGIAAGAVVIGIPTLFLWLRDIYLDIVRRRTHSRPWNVAELLRPLTVFRLPESIRRSHGWFAIVYYGTIVGALITAPGLITWHLLQTV